MKAAETISHIVRDKQGAAWIDGKNVKVVEVVLDHLSYGWSADAIHEQHPDLSLAEIHSALAFYYDHTRELEAEIAEQEKKVKNLRGTANGASFQRRLRGLPKKR
jgi:uncharacterized protein (DUF433 family)